MPRARAIFCGAIVGISLVTWAFHVSVSNFLTQTISSIPRPAICRNCNIVLVSFDTLRADDLPCYGYIRNTAPNLCRFADRNVSFINAYSESSITLDSHFSIFTSLYPSVHKVLNIFKDELSPEILTLPQILQSRGYDTIYNGVFGDPMLPLEKGLGRGFAVTLPIASPEDPWQKGIQLFRANVQKGKPTFLFLHTYQMHDPYLVGHTRNYVFTDMSVPSIITTEEEFRKFSPEIPPLAIHYLQSLFSLDAEFNGQTNRTFLNRFIHASSLQEAKAVFDDLSPDDQTGIFENRYVSRIQQNNSDIVAFLRAMYDEKIYQFDRSFISFFDLLNDEALMKHTIVVITGDHGEEFLENGMWGHGSNLYNSNTHVPLIMHVPGITDERITDLVQSIDILPTILGIVGISPPSYAQGINLLGILQQKKSAQTNRYIISEHRGGFIRSIRDSQWKLYMNDPSFVDRGNELYNLINDPSEQQNVIREHTDIVARLTKALDDMRAKWPTFKYAHTEFPDWINQKIRDHLIRNGYFNK